MSKLIQTTFEYSEPDETATQEPVHETRWDEGLSAETCEFVQQKADEIHGQMKRTAEGIIRIGQNLIAVKGKLDHGQFLPWLKAEFAMSENAALKFMQVAERFGSKSINFMNLPVSVLYALAAPSTLDAVVEKVLTGEIPASLEAIKAEKEAEKRRADEAEQAMAMREEQLEELRAEVATLQQQLEEQRPEVIEKRVENPETMASLVRLQQKYAEMEAQLRIKTERVKQLSDEIHLHNEMNRQERYNEEVRYKWRQACESFQQGISQGMTRMVTPLDAAAAFVSDDWARLGSVEIALKRALSELAQLRESVSSQVVDGSVEEGL